MTPIQGDPGFCDLLLLRGERGLAVELKAQRGNLTAQQADWLAAWALIPGFLAGVWRPLDWLEGTIERLLR